MARTEEIYAVAAVFARPEAESAAALRALCAAAEQELTASLRPEVTAEACRESLICAAALLAAGRFCAGGAAAGVRAFTMGSVSVTAGGAQTADDLCTQAMLLMRPFSRRGFAFAGVRG